MADRTHKRDRNEETPLQASDRICPGVHDEGTFWGTTTATLMSTTTTIRLQRRGQREPVLIKIPPIGPEWSEMG